MIGSCLVPPARRDLAPPQPRLENTLTDEYRDTLMSAVDAACRGDLQALLIAQWMLGSLRSRMATIAADHATPPAQ